MPPKRGGKPLVNKGSTNGPNQGGVNANAPPDPNNSIVRLEELLNQHRQNQPPVAGAPPARQAQNVATFKSFKSLNPPEFHGTSYPIAARVWLREIKKTFEIVGVENDKKTLFAAYMLKEEANYWWEAKRNLEGTTVISWDRFMEIFLEKYFPRHMEAQMELKFLQLKQDSMTAAEYENKFSELSRFVPHYVDTDAKRTRCFQQGMTPWIQNKVAVLEILDYATLV
ncbi:uncharacterized protein LOC141660410 [Apium graveolens]|uniref:uncharacterized protein LOC141660410 n=1 Tax=Apium graveolens TaxID=4045 RepID=UPI003D7A57AE